MNNLKNSLLATIICLFFAISLQAANKVNFYSGSFPAARENAKKLNRPMFLYFTASWCMPCRLMDETTWQDPNLAKYIEDNYIGLKIDTDVFENYHYKEKFKIQAYPTIIFLNPDGEFIARQEGSVTGSELLRMMESHDNFTSLAPSDIPDGEPVVASPTYNTSNVPQPVPTFEVNNVEYIEVATKPNTPTGTDHMSGYQKKTDKLIATGSGLFRFSVEREPSEGFSVQVGVYADYDNVLREVSSYQEKFKEPILVHIDQLKDKTVYRVLIGDFNKKDRAIRYKSKILENGIPDAIVKDLSLLK